MLGHRVQSKQLNVQLTPGSGRIFHLGHRQQTFLDAMAVAESGQNRPKIRPRHFQPCLPGSPARGVGAAVPLSPLKDHPRVHPGVFSSLSSLPRGHLPFSRAAKPHPAPGESQQQLQAASPQCTKRIYSLSKFHFNFTSPAAPAPPPASPSTFVPGETPNPTAPRAGSPQLPQLNPLRGRRRRRIRNGFAQMCCTTFKKAEASLAEKPVLGSPEEPQTSLPTALRTHQGGINPLSPRRGWLQVRSLLPPAQGGDTNPSLESWESPASAQERLDFSWFLLTEGVKLMAKRAGAVGHKIPGMDVKISQIFDDPTGRAIKDRKWAHSRNNPGSS